ncbi:hypothetical protein CLHUN_30680 [Ruminiclostridium hungatei]|uniref:Uncharacterized protein n=1 Tax=Ruminiclostridium hungatei TaxID=48256 RepID=A0A1V4SHZ2_RUMHU|nr:hypothetical protein CLHUN_30680 [Ruminiclostridium hungatei]
MELHPVKRTVKNIKYSRLVVYKATGRFLCREVVIAFASATLRGHWNFPLAKRLYARTKPSPS